MEVATGNLSNPSSGYTDLAVIQGAGRGSTAAARGGDRTRHCCQKRCPSVWPCSPEGSCQSSRKAGSGSLPPSKSHVRVSALDHSKLSTLLPRGPLPKLPSSSCLPPPGPAGCGSVGHPCVGKSGPAAAPSGSQAALLSSSVLPASRSPGCPVPGMSRLWHRPRPLLQLACLQATVPPSYASECFLTHILKFNVLCVSKSMY